MEKTNVDWYEMTRLPPSADAVVDVVDASGKAQTLTATAAVAAVRRTGGGLCVPDAAALSRVLVNAGADVCALCALAAENRVLCRRLARRLGAAPGPPGEMLARLAAFGAAQPVDPWHGPGGVFAAGRGALALGVASAAGLACDPGRWSEAVDACARVADCHFEALSAHPDAARLFNGGAHAAPDEHGFRPLQPSELRSWLAGQLSNVTDRLRLPVPTPLEPTGSADVQVRHWSAWAVGTEPLATLAGLQDAEYLGDALRGRRAGARVQPRYPNPPEPVSAGPDLGAYRRLRATAIPACFVPAGGTAFVRVDLGELPLVLLGAPRATTLTGGLTAATGVTLSGEQASVLAALATSGASDAAVAVGLGRLANLPVTREQAGRLVRALVGRLPALANHLRDPTPERLARHTRAGECELVAWTRYTPPQPGAEGSLFRQFLESDLTDEFLTVEQDDSVLERLRRRPPRAPEYQPGGPALGFRRSGYPSIEREQVRTLSGEVIPCTAWVEARAAAAVSAHRIVTGVAFALVAAGHRVVAVTPTEVLVEAPVDRVDTLAIDRTVASAIRDFVECDFVPASRTHDRW